MMERHPATPNLQQFLRELPIITRRDDDDAIGVTWFELYIVFRMEGYPQPLKPMPNEVAPKPTLRHQLHAYRTIFCANHMCDVLPS